MNPRHPIDEFFREKLEGYELDPPLHVWANIQEARAQQPPPSFGRRYRRSMLTLLALVAGAMAAGLLWLPPEPALASFPIPAGPAPAVQVPPPPAPAATAARKESPPPATAAIPARPAAPAPLPALEVLPSREVGVVAERETAGAEAPSLLPAREIVSPLPVFAAAHSPELPLPLDREPKCVRFGQPANLKFFVDAAFTPLWPSRTFTAKSSEYQQYADLREQTERPRLSFGAGARLSVVTNFGLALRTGVHFTQINEKFNYTDNSEETITITNIYGPNGEFIRTDTLIEFGAHQQTARNRYRMIDIPLILGYEIRRKHWTVAFNGGALINLSLQAKGEFYSPEAMEPIEFPSDQINTVPAYRENIGIGWFASIGLHYQIGEGLQVMVEPQLRYFPQSITQDDYVLDQHYLTSGLALGIRKRI